MTEFIGNRTELISRILSDVETNGREDIIRLLNEDPVEVKEVLELLCSTDHLLHRACILGDEELVVFLSAFTSDVNAESPLGTPLSIACKHGYETIVDIFCNQAIVPTPVPFASLADDDCSVGEFCPFYQAASNGWVNILKQLINAKPETFQELEACQNLLKIACYGGQIEALQFCIDLFSKTAEFKHIIQSFVREELLVVCLELNRSNLLSCFFGAKGGATISEDLADRYSDAIGRYLRQCAVFQEPVNQSSSDDTQSFPDPSDASVSFDWSCRSLHTMKSVWLIPFASSLRDLDLSDNDLRILPDIIPWHLSNLRKLIVSNSKLEVLLSPSSGAAAECQRLQFVDLSRNLLTDLPVELFDLPLLENLILTSNRISVLYGNSSMQDQAIQWGCVALKELNVSQNLLEALPFQMHSCISLTSLKLSQNKLINFAHPWSCPLKYLDLSENALSDLPLAMDDFWSKTLQHLNLSKNRLTECPQTVCRLAVLKELNISHNSLCWLPNPDWWDCAELETLDLSHNMLGTLSLSTSTATDVQRSFIDRINPAWLPRFRSSSPSSRHSSAEMPASLSASSVCFPKTFSQSLIELNLSYNQLKEFPPSIVELTELIKLDLSHNAGISSLPHELSQLNNLQHLYLTGLCFTDRNLKRRVQNDNAIIVLAYLKQIHRQCIPYHRIKLMLVGNQEKGKTSLAYLLRDVPRPTLNVATNGVEISEFKLSSSSGLTFKKASNPDLTVQLWDFAGQCDYYVTHKVFLSSSALYLVIYDLRLGLQGADGLHAWLSDIQAHAPNSNVLIVGTFLDCLTEARNKLPELRNYIKRTYFKKRGYPTIEGIVEISNVGRKEGLDSLRKLIYEVALRIRVRVDNYGKVNLVGRMFSGYCIKTDWNLSNPKDFEKFTGILADNLQVPKDYLELIKLLQKEVELCRKEERWPVLNDDQFWKLFSSLSNSNILSKEEMELAAQFLNESGYLLHFVSSSFSGLEQIYFIDPQWLAQTLARFISVDAAQRFTRGGLINMKDAEAALLFSGSKTSISFEHYVDLLEAFDIALRLDNEKLLLPSKLPMLRPGLQSSVQPKSVRLEARRLIRIYRMNHIPSGFWSRLIVQMLAAICELQGPVDGARNVGSGGLREPSTRHRSVRLGNRNTRHEARQSSFQHLNALDEFTDPKVTFWQQGICIDCGSYELLIEPADEYLDSTASRSSSLPSFEFGKDEDELRQGIVVTVTKSSGEEDSSNRSFILATFAIDYIDSLITQWYPGLLDEGCLEQLIPCPYCLVKRMRKSYSITFSGVHMFSLIECAKIILSSRSSSDFVIRCDVCESPQINLRFLIPDLLLLDLPSHLHIGAAELEYDPFIDVLGRGGEGTVYRGTFHDRPVAIKQNGIVESCRSLATTRTASDSSGSSELELITDQQDLLVTDFFWKVRTLGAFNGFRQETCVLARLRHPCVISLLGVCAPTLSYIMEISPHGSLRHIFLKNQEMLTSPDREGKLLLNKLLKYKIIYQIICGLRYLHAEGIVYKDLKPENVLVWSLEVDDLVNVKLSDYGLARRLTKQGLMGIEGTTGYQAPEIRLQKAYNEKVDIFAYAMVLHEVMTEEACFEEISCILVNKFILQGKRPVNNASKIIAPQMMSLIEKCWAQNPNDRPSAAEICDILSDVTFISRETVVSLEANRILGSLAFIFWDRGLGLRNPYLRFWTGNHSGRCYHVFNAAVGQFKIFNQCYPGPRVSCMILVNNFMIIGSEESGSTCLQVMGLNKETSRLDKLSDPLPTDDVPLLLLDRNTTPSEVVVGFANSDLRLYSLESSSLSNEVSLLHKQTVHLSDSNHSIICGLWLNDGKELWVGCGPNVVVLGCSGPEGLKVEAKIQIFPLTSTRISKMCAHADQMWCLSKRDSIVVELDVESRNILCILDCSQQNPLNKVVSNFDWVETLRRVEPVEMAEPVATGLPVAEVKVPPRPLVQAKAPPFEKRTGLGRSASYRRKLLSKARSRSTEKKFVSGPTNVRRVRSMCYVRGALWLGRENGDILVVNVTHSNPYEFEHGLVIGILHYDEARDKNLSVEHLLNMNDERVISAMTSREVKNARQSTHLITWSPVGLDRIHQYKQIWKSLNEETFSRKSKSVKSSSLFF